MRWSSRNGCALKRTRIQETLKALVDHELERRERDRQELLAKEEMKIKRAANSIMLWGFLFTLANGLILALYLSLIHISEPTRPY